MNIFKLALRSSLTFAFFGILRAALFIYVLFLPDSPQAGVVPNGDVRSHDSVGRDASRSTWPDAS
jgi:hypothetical protein